MKTDLRQRHSSDTTARDPSPFNANITILNTKFIIFNTKFIILDTKFIIFNALPGPSVAL